jgi:P27 family predicted phage terminase small subunit
MGVLTSWDRDAFAVLCEEVATHRAAAEIVRREGITVPGARGRERVRHPAVQIMRDSAQTIRAYAQEFGLTPSARSGIRLPDEISDAALRLLSPGSR